MKFITYAIYFMLVMQATSWVIDSVYSKDNSDPIDGRSGFVIMTDSLTGCQYLQSGIFGGLSPRYDGNDKQICRK